MLLAGAASGLTAAADAGAAPHVQATQELVVLVTAHAAHTAPEAGSPQVALISAHTSITGEQSTLPVIARSIGADGARWLRVMLPGRPDGLTGWISQAGHASAGDAVAPGGRPRRAPRAGV